MQRGRVFPLLLVTFLISLSAFAMPLSASRAQEATPPTTTATKAASAAAFRAGPDRNGVLQGAGPKGTPVVLWRFRTGDRLFSSPVAANGLVYFGSNDHRVYAVDAASGRERWAFEAAGEVGSTPAVANNKLFVGDVAGTIYALDATNGERLWSYATGGSVISSPVIADGKVIVGSDDGILYALNATDGSVLWRYQTEGPVQSSPAIAEEMVFVGSLDDHIYALDLAAGTERWRAKTNGDIFSTPAVAYGLVFVGSLDGNLYAFDVTDGRNRWAFKTGDAVYSSPTVTNGVVFAGSYDKQLYAVNAASGDKVWAYDVGSAVLSSPIVVGAFVYVGAAGGLGASGGVHAVNRTTGAKRWIFPIDAAVLGSPTISQQILFVGSGDGNLRAIGGVEQGGGMTAAVEVPAPEDCDLAPRSLDDLRRLQRRGKAEARDEQPATAEATQGYTPEGEPVGAATVAGITDTLRKLYSCVNADNPKRAMSLFSDSYLSRRLAALATIDQAMYDALEGADPPTARRGVLPAIGWIRLLDDGRVRAQIQGVTPELPDAGVIAYYTFVRVDDRWLIDDVLVVAANAQAGA